MFINVAEVYTYVFINLSGFGLMWQKSTHMFYLFGIYYLINELDIILSYVFRFHAVIVIN
jgi:hypothetical protein